MSKIWIYIEIDGVQYMKAHNEQEIVLIDSKIHTFNPDFTYVTFDQQIPAKHYDICIAEKVLWFSKSKTLENIHQRYFHKPPTPHNTPKQCLNLYDKIFRAQSKEKERRNLGQAINFEVAFSPFLYAINKVNIPVNKALVDKDMKGYNDTIAKLSDSPLRKKSEVQAYLKKKNIGVYDYHKCEYNMKHDILLKTKDPLIMGYVYRAKAVSKATNLMPIEGFDSMSPNHKQYSTVTGRIQTYDPPLQSYGKYLNYGMSLDFVAQELMIYMQVFKPPVYAIYRQYKLKDIYGLIYHKVTGNPTHPDTVKAKFPKSRKRIKLMILILMNGCTRIEFAYHFGYRDWMKMPIYDKLLDILKLDEAKASLLDYVNANKAYRMCDKLNKVVRCPETVNYHLKLLATEGRGMQDAVDRFYFQDLEDARNLVLLKCMNKLVQGLGAIILKKAVRNCFEVLGSNEILLLVHDDIRFRNEDNADKIEEAMKEAHKVVMDDDIEISKTVN